MAAYWIPKQKRTDIEYPPITDEEKKSREEHDATKGKFTYRRATKQDLSDHNIEIPAVQPPVESKTKKKSKEEQESDKKG